MIRDFDHAAAVAEAAEAHIEITYDSSCLGFIATVYFDTNEHSFSSHGKPYSQAMHEFLVDFEEQVDAWLAMRNQRIKYVKDTLSGTIQDDGGTK